MKAIVVPQPHAWLVTNGYCDIINQIWSTEYTGKVLIYASSKKLTDKRYSEAMRLLSKYQRLDASTLPAKDALQTGGIQGYATITGCVKSSHSAWFKGPYGLTLSAPGVVTFVKDRCKNGVIFESAFELEDLSELPK